MTKKTDINESDVIGKLDKAADALESTSRQLSGVVTQQQLDLVARRISTCEVDLNSINIGAESLARRTAAHAHEAADAFALLEEKIKELEKEFSGLRALTMSAFALATIGLVGLIILSVF